MDSGCRQQYVQNIKGRVFISFRREVGLGRSNGIHTVSVSHSGGALWSRENTLWCKNCSFCPFTAWKPLSWMKRPTRRIRQATKSLLWHHLYFWMKSDVSPVRGLLNFYCILYTCKCIFYIFASICVQVCSIFQGLSHFWEGLQLGRGIVSLFTCVTYSISFKNTN